MTGAKGSKAGLAWLLRMAWRDGKANYGKFVLFLLSIALGVTAVVSIHAFGETLEQGIAQQSKSLLGADYVVESDRPANTRVQQLIDSMGGSDAREINFLSMAAFPGNPGTKLVDVRGLEGPFPLYGELETDPPGAAGEFWGGKALLDATAMLQLNLRAGDSIKIGKLTLPIAGALRTVPGSNSFFGSIAPPVLLPMALIDSTGLVQTGSRIEYKYYFRAEQGQDLVLLNQEMGPLLEAEQADLDTHESESRRLGRRYANFGKFLNLVAFIALLLGCVGIASGMNIHIKEKLRSIAILKCLGATRRQAFMIFFVQVGLMGLLGGALGTLLGQFLQQFLPLLAQDLLPLEVNTQWSGQSGLLGMALGLVMSLLFALYPLIDTLYVSPLQALRVVNQRKKESRRAALGVALGIVLFVYGFSHWLLGDLSRALAFVGALVLVFLVMVGLTQGAMGLLRRHFPHRWGFMARQGLHNLLGPKNQTLTLVLAIGIGSFLMGTLYFSRDMLLSKASLGDTAQSANMVLMDVQREQMDSVVAHIASHGLPVIDRIPIVTMRVESIKGKGVDQIRKDSTSQVGGWILNHEFRVTYRDSLIDSETLLAGRWLPGPTLSGKVPVSVSEDFARRADVGVGDGIGFNVQGRVMDTEVRSVRQVDWSRMQPNFSVVFPKGPLDNAPQFGIVTTRVPDPGVSAKLQGELVAHFPNVSILDLMRLLEILGGLLDKMAWVINFMAFFSLFVGAMVLLGTIHNSKHQRIRQSALLKTLGAKGSQIGRLYAFEYAFLGLLGASAGILLSLVGSLILSWTLFETAFVPSLFPFVVILPGIVTLVFLLGVSNSLGPIRSTPLKVLRGGGNG